MTNKIKGSYIAIDESSITTKKSKVRQLVDVIQSDIKGGSSTRKKYEVFVSGGTNLQSITSGLFQTVHDQDHTLQTSNAMFDITIGLYAGGETYKNAITSTDSGGKDLFNNSHLMMREKSYIYKQYAQNILGDPDASFKAPFDSTTSSDVINEAVFININRLFTRDKISKESFAMRFYKKAAILKDDSNYNAPNTNDEVEENMTGSLSITGISTGMPNVTGETYTKIYDLNALSNKKVHPIAGEYETLKDDSSDPVNVGLIFYDLGILVLDAKKAFASDQIIRGLIQDVESTDSYVSSNSPVTKADHTDFPFTAGTSVFEGSFIPNFWREGSIDDIIDHICETRFGEANLTSFAFKNETQINSSLIFCRAAPSQLNFSTNPTYTDSNGKLRVITEDDDAPFSYITTIGLHNASNELLAVAKLSRPVEKNEETDLSIRIRLDY